MLASFRRHLDSWVARAFFLLLVATFVLWGIGSALPTLFGSSTTVANVGGQKIELPAMQAAYQRALTQVTRALGTQVQPTPAMRQGVAAQALEQLITQTALSEAADRMGLGVSKAAL
ncbi:MAG: SurA N-terminal domain-containing protein, partial [Rhodospirillales bacterium]|nr:SurA N-terminal domain-containing protein [Rhodospirillales bacterium]